MTQYCDDPVIIDLVRNQEVQETAWRRDRVALASCRDRHKALVDYTLGLLAELGAEEN